MRVETVWPRIPPQRLRRELQEGEGSELRARRSAILFSMLGMAAMGAVSAFQTGIVRRLPDPPGPFDTEKVNSSRTAYRFGLPDGTVSLASLALNVPLMALGGRDRARRHRWIPMLAAVKTGIEAAVGAWYFYQMPAREKAWCPYCVVGAVANIGVFASVVPEARSALRWRREESGR